MKYKRVRGGTMRGSLLAPQKTFWTPSPGSSMLICKMQVKIECWAGSSGEGRGGGGGGVGGSFEPTKLKRDIIT